MLLRRGRQQYPKKSVMSYKHKKVGLGSIALNSRVHLFEGRRRQENFGIGTQLVLIFSTLAYHQSSNNYQGTQKKAPAADCQRLKVDQQTPPIFCCCCQTDNEDKEPCHHAGRKNDVALLPPTKNYDVVTCSDGFACRNVVVFTSIATLSINSSDFIMLLGGCSDKASLIVGFAGHAVSVQTFLLNKNKKDKLYVQLWLFCLMLCLGYK